MAPDGGNEDLWCPLHLEQDLVHMKDGHRPGLGADGPEHVDVGPGGKELGQIGHQDRGVDRLIEADLVDRGVEVVREGLVVAVCRRTVQVDQRDAIRLLADRDCPRRRRAVLHPSLLCVP
jgi:hypothetical protein